MAIGDAEKPTMSMIDLKSALAETTPRRAVFVSDSLFWELYDELELTPRKHEWRSPRDFVCKKVLDALLINQRLPKADKVEDMTWHLVHHGMARVVRCPDFGRTHDHGPNSFEIF
jgi:hypothetical protein